MSYTLRQNPSPFYTHNRNGQKINKIVIHTAATTDFDGIGRTFKSDRVSAGYGVGRNQNVDQYVADVHAAWHAGNYEANMTSIGIESVNSTGAPNWLVANETFDTLVELVRDLAKRHGLGKLVVGKNLFPHYVFRATACPTSLKNRLQELADRVNGSPSKPQPAPKPPTGKKTNEQIADEVMAGSWGNNPQRTTNLKKSGYDPNAIQRLVNARYNMKSKPVATRPQVNSTVVQRVLAGAYGNGDARKANLIRAGYNYDEVQRAVNAALGVKAKTISRKSDTAIANEVIQGKWGNNPQRSAKLQRAGYNPNAIQALVNRKLGF